MLVALTKATRLKAGRLVALAYLLCVATPSATFAFGDGTRAAPCLTENEHGRGPVHVHEHAVSAHADGHDHAHSVEASRVHASLAAATDAVEPSSDDAAGDHHKSGGACCGLMCVTALPAAIAEFGRPAAPETLCVSVIYRNVADSAPPRHYRPPIS
jgi:hypothetical protein